MSTIDPRLISYLTLRKAIGWLGMGLPPAMMAGNFIFGNCPVIQDSVSHYYYTITGSLFIGILSSVALFLFTYKGYEKLDHISTSLAGFFAICIALFPTNDSSAHSCAIIHLPDSSIRSAIHYVAAGSFFLTIALISIFLFTKSKGRKTKEKKIRNGVYRACGIVIIAAITGIAIIHWLTGEPDGNNKFKPVFWLEWVALLAFGISWLVKGEIVLKDHSLK
jgi:hypothetical protein